MRARGRGACSGCVLGVRARGACTVDARVLRVAEPPPTLPPTIAAHAPPAIAPAAQPAPRPPWPLALAPPRPVARVGVVLLPQRLVDGRLVHLARAAGGGRGRVGVEVGVVWGSMAAWSTLA